MSDNAVFWLIAVLTIVVVVAAAYAATRELSQQRTNITAFRLVWQWLKRFAFVYCIPALIIGGATLYITATEMMKHWLFSLVRSDFNLRMAEFMIGIEFLMLGYINAIGRLRSKSKEPNEVVPAPRSTSTAPPAIDARKWHLNRDTGEYHRVIHRRGDEVLVETKTYRERATAELAQDAERKVNRGAITIFSVAAALFFFGAKVAHAGWDIIIGAFGVAWAICAFVFAIFWLGTLRKVEVGPPPIAAPGRDEVEGQNVHGSGGILTREEIDFAARGAVPDYDRKQTFHD